MKASYLKAGFALLSLILMMGFVMGGCKKETPAQPESAAGPPTTTEKPIAEESAEKPSPEQQVSTKEQEFLSDPDVVTCELEQTTISKLDLPRNNMASFIRRMERDNRENVKQAQFTLADRPLKVIVADKPEREFYLYDTGTGIGPYWWGSWSLYSYHKINDKFIEFMQVENGTKIAARPYKGPLGTFMVGKGGRELEKVEFKGSVHQKDNVAAPIGIIKEHSMEAVGECRIPVGDYTSYIMHVTYDNLDICISNNYHTNAQGQSGPKNIIYGMQVREDKPYVLDFSNEPMVVFHQPAAGQTAFSRGQEIKFAAVLIDPKLDIMIRGLEDTSIKVDKEYKDATGKVIHTAKVNKSLDPNVVIARAGGEVISEGVMPFG